MAYKIDCSCVNCGNCINECSLGAIHRNGDVCEVDEHDCISCGACEMCCPVGAIREDR